VYVDTCLRMSRGGSGSVWMRVRQCVCVCVRIVCQNWARHARDLPKSCHHLLLTCGVPLLVKIVTFDRLELASGDGVAIKHN
jgi:hypothetical protein